MLSYSLFLIILLASRALRHTHESTRPTIRQFDLAKLTEPLRAKLYGCCGRGWTRWDPVIPFDKGGVNRVYVIYFNRRALRIQIGSEVDGVLEKLAESTLIDESVKEGSMCSVVFSTPNWDGVVREGKDNSSASYHVKFRDAQGPSKGEFLEFMEGDSGETSPFDWLLFKKVDLNFA